MKLIHQMLIKAKFDLPAEFDFLMAKRTFNSKFCQKLGVEAMVY